MDPRWRFESPGAIAPGVGDRFIELIIRAAEQGARKEIYEIFKNEFSRVGNTEYWSSSNEHFALQDLKSLISSSSGNAPLFIEAFWAGCKCIQGRYPQIHLPDVARINSALIEADAGYQLDLPKLIATRAHMAIPIPSLQPSVDAQARQLIEEALAHSERQLAAGNGRQAVQEVLWVLETVATAFRGVNLDSGTIQGLYFNKIIRELRQRGRGHQTKILEWMMELHGYLSSPTGGGVRCGIDVKDGVSLEIEEAHFYCNLIRSYTIFLMAQHDRISRADS